MVLDGKAKAKPSSKAEDGLPATVLREGGCEVVGCCTGWCWGSFASSTRREGCDDPAIEAKRGAYASPAAGSACSFPMRKVSMCGRGVVFAHRLKLDLGVTLLQNGHMRLSAGIICVC